MNRFSEAVSRWLATPRTTGPNPSFSFCTRLSSALPQAYFQAAFQVIYQMEGGRPPTIPRPGIELRLCEIAQRAVQAYSVLDAGGAQSATNLALWNEPHSTGGDARFLHASATLAVQSADREFAERHELIQRETALAQTAQLAELDKWRFLAERILPDPALARLWWMDGKRERLAELLTMDGVFERAALLVTRRSEPGEQADPTAGLIHDFLKGLGPHHRALLIKQLSGVFVGYEREDLADRLRTSNQPPVPRPDHKGQPDGRPL